MDMTIRDVLERYRKGELESDEAERLLRLDYVRKIGEHTLFDPRRSERKDVPEIIYGEGKSPAVVAEIVGQALQDKDHLIISRASIGHMEAVCGKLGVEIVRYEKAASMIIVDRRPRTEFRGLIGILAAGTSDVRVAEEAKVVVEAMGVGVTVAYDVGIAGFHRLLDPLTKMLDQGVDALIVVAGMEGALASVVSSLVDVPVIGVPTSVGYGAGGNGKGALLTMLQSCSPGLAVVNIDNGVGAGATAGLISLRCRRSK
ncbi:MAG: nickel pincer cofactor biosynthesis protein LarB [Methanomassiliicoccus sp.]|nr:nickel pincer cofactor biosynthesis protein LarB [Methanomassiliicoccus sp.]